MKLFAFSLLFMVGIPLSSASSINSLIEKAKRANSSEECKWFNVFCSKPQAEFAKSYSKKECREAVEDLVETSVPGDIKFFAHFETQFLNFHIQDDEINTLSVNKSVRHIGLSKNYYKNAAGGLSPENAPHLFSGCLQYFELGTSVLVPNKIMNYPIYEKNKLVGVNSVEKLCRETTLSIDELSYKVIFCEGDKQGYTEI